MKNIIITGGCKEYWYSKFTGCIFEVVGEKENDFLIKPIGKFIYPYQDHLLYLFQKEDELLILKYDTLVVKNKNI